MTSWWPLVSGSTRPLETSTRVRIGVALFAHPDQDAAPVAAPDRTAGVRPARRALIAADAAVHVEVVVLGEIARRPAGEIHHPEIRLRVGALGAAMERADEGKAFAVRRRRVCADAPVDARQARRLTAIPRHGVKIAVEWFVVRLLAAVGDEVDVRAVDRPSEVAHGKLSGCQPLRRSDPGFRGRRCGRPDVGRAIAIHVAGIRDTVRTIDRFRDHADVARARPVLGPHVVLDEVLGTRGRRKGNRAAVRRPDGIAGAPRDIGDCARLATRPRQHMNLRSLRPAVFLDCARESQPGAIGRPSRSDVARPARELHRRFGPVRSHTPD